MPESPTLRRAIRVAAVVAMGGLISGVFAVAQSSGAAANADAPKPVVTTTSTTAPPPTTTTVAPPTTAPNVAPARAVASRPPAPRPAPAPAPVVRAQTAQQRGEEALSLIKYPWQTLGYAIVFEPERAGYLGMTNEGTKVISIYVRQRQSLDSLARTIAHEIAHALDFTVTTDDERNAYIAIRGINATLESWYGCNECTDFSTAAGDWSETFQYWLLGDGEFFSKMGPKPSPEQLAQLGSVFAAQ